jgi:aminoglycoside/choline kinase family phosphotransferase
LNLDIENRRDHLDLDFILERYFKKEVVPAAVLTLKGDASSRQYHRVTLTTGVEPKTLVVMELPADALKSDEATDGEIPAELPFLNMGRFFEKKGLRVPEVYLDATEDGALLIEDMGDVLFFDKVERAADDTVRAWYAAAVDLLAELHEKLWPIPDGCVAVTRQFDYELLRWELDHYREWGIEALRPAPLNERVRQTLDRAFDALAREVAALPRGFVHRDYQSRNLMVLNDDPASGSLGIIDFQDALAGPVVYDLVALLNDSYVDLPASLKHDMVLHYAATRDLAGDELVKAFHLVTIQRKLKDGGRFVFIDRVKNNPWFLPYVDGSFARVRQSLDALAGHESLNTALADADPDHFG